MAVAAACVDRAAQLDFVDLLAREVHERAKVELGLAVRRFGVGDPELGGAKLDLDPVEVSQRSVAVLVQVLRTGIEAFQPLDADPRIAQTICRGDSAPIT